MSYISSITKGPRGFENVETRKTFLRKFFPYKILTKNFGAKKIIRFFK